MDASIIKYLESQNVFVLATSSKLQSYCSICFYAYHREDNVIVFLSGDSTRHIKEALANSKVSGSVMSQDVNVAKMKGIQFTGSFRKPTNIEFKKYKGHYLNKHPLAKLVSAECWVIDLEFIKMTNNTLGFGKKIIWEKEKALF